MVSVVRKDPVLGAAGTVELLLGNESIVRGALEAGVAFASGYPGTASSEVTDTFSRVAPGLGIHFEYSVNEKIAVEMAFAASIAGARSIVAMKHLGLAYAGDPLTTMPYIGTVGGMVIVSAGDPSLHTSPNEQDQRHLADMLHIPTLEPSTPQQALEMTRFAFELSERCQLPVLLRPTTRVCHTRSRVTLGSMTPPKVTGFVRDPKRFVPIPANARRLRRDIPRRLEVARDALAETDFASASGSGRRGVLAFGVTGATCADLFAEFGVVDVVLLRLGIAFPLPEAWLIEQLEQLDTLLVLEEMSPFIEEALHSLCTRHSLKVTVLGKHTEHLPVPFEYVPDVIRAGLYNAFGIGEPPVSADAQDYEPPPLRAPVLCSACPHRSSFFAARSAFGPETLFFSDIGCYTLGYGAPLDAADALLCMGAGFTLAAGVSRTTGQRTVGFVGDSTFFHSGMPALLNAIKENANMVAVVLDNQVTAMTGFQESPTIQILNDEIRRKVDFEGIARALGATHVESIEPNNLGASIAAFERARDNDGLSVVIAKEPCPVYMRRLLSDAKPPAEPQPVTYRIDPARCQSCGRDECGQRCDVGTMRQFDQVMARARSLEVIGPDRQPDKVAACATACPLHLCVQGYAGHIAAGDYAEAVDLIMSKLPLPSSVCRVCDHPCETACVRSAIDEPVAVNDLKRFVMDWADAQPDSVYRPQVTEPHGKRVAVVGAGPAGLAAAYDLRVRGYDVTLMDRDAEPGGLLRTGIPEYRLPHEVLNRDIGRILELGVVFRGNQSLGVQLQLDTLVTDYDAVCIAVGASVGIELDLPGDTDLRRVEAIEFLRDAPSGGLVAGKHTIVIGGGNSAVDAARTSLRCGAQWVTMICLEDEASMPAIRDEIVEARAEGVNILLGHRVERAVAGGLEVVQVQGRDNATLPLRPKDYVDQPGTERQLKADLVIFAVGQRPAVDAIELASHPRVFACGDVTNESRTVTEAIAGGLRAGWQIDCMLRGDKVANTRMPAPKATVALSQRKARRTDKEARLHPAHLPGDTRVEGFAEVVGSLTESEARAEAARCMICGMCGNCRSCLDLFGCPAFFLRDSVIEIDAALCVACGVCAELCPNQAITPVYAQESP